MLVQSSIVTFLVCVCMQMTQSIPIDYDQHWMPSKFPHDKFIPSSHEVPMSFLKPYETKDKFYPSPYYNMDDYKKWLYQKGYLGSFKGDSSYSDNFYPKHGDYMWPNSYPQHMDFDHTFQKPHYSKRIDIDGQHQEQYLIDTDEMPIQVLFKSPISPINVQQQHMPYSQETIHPLYHRVSKPVIQEVHEVIAPYRKVTHDIHPLKEEMGTMVTSGSGLNNRVSAPSGNFFTLNKFQDKAEQSQRLHPQSKQQQQQHQQPQQQQPQEDRSRSESSREHAE